MSKYTCTYMYRIHTCVQPHTHTNRYKCMYIYTFTLIHYYSTPLQIHIQIHINVHAQENIHRTIYMCPHMYIHTKKANTHINFMHIVCSSIYLIMHTHGNMYMHTQNKQVYLHRCVQTYTHIHKHMHTNIHI